MPESAGAEMRIYCICGQKMKVSESMFGRPGKCIACRQKIRIPRPEELDGDGTEVRLREHPEFLRRTQPPEAAPEEADPAEKGEETIELGAADGELEAVALEVLEPLRMLCSFAYRIDSELADEATPEAERPALLGYRALVRSLRDRLDDRLRKKLIESGGELTEVKEKIADTGVSFRLGEIRCDAYLSTMLSLRRKRELLERRRQNLRGWLVVDDPYEAGGYQEVRLDEIPVEMGEPKLPPEPRQEKALLNQAIDELREALRRVEHADRKLEEWARMSGEGAMTAGDLAAAQAGSGAERKRAIAAAAYHRQRLTQVMRDCEQDLLAARARQKAAHKERDDGMLDADAFRRLDHALVRIESDNVQARDLAEKALAAKTAEEIPGAHGTFLRRMAQPPAPSGIGVDAVLAWIAAILMVLNIVVPISNAQALGNRVVLQSLVMGLFLTAVALALAAAVPSRRLRGLLINVVFVGGCFGGMHYLNEAWYGLDPVGRAMRANPEWMLVPGVMLFFAADAIMGLSALLSLIVLPRWRWVPVGAIVLVLLGVAAIFTDGAGLWGPKPALLTPEPQILSAKEGRHAVVFSVLNEGRRPIWAGALATEDPVPVRVSVQRRNDAGGWEDTRLPAPVGRRDGGGRLPLLKAESPAVMLTKGQSQQFRVELPAGTYRARLESGIPGYQVRYRQFTLDAPAPAQPNPAVSSPPADAPPPDTGNPSPAETVGPNDVLARLRAAVGGSDRKPVFTVTLTMPDGATVQRRVGLNDTLHGPWIALEFNPTRKTLTVTDGDRMLVLETGTNVPLPDAAGVDAATPDE